MHQSLDRKKIGELEDIFPKCKIGVVGDFALDGYWHADMTTSELSREAPLFLRPISTEKYSPGGAANVAWNLIALKIGEVHAFSTIGNDWRGSILSSILEEHGVRMDGVIISNDWQTPFFGKIILSAFGNKQEDSRIDFVNRERLSINLQEEIIENINQKIGTLSALIIADYISLGLMGDYLIEQLNNIAKKFPEKFFIVDSRNRLEKYQSMSIKPNEVEARQLFKMDNTEHKDIEELINAGKEWYQSHGCPIFLTLANQGCLLYQEAGCMHIPTIEVPPPIDPVGAGDTFLASLTSGLVGGLSPEEAVFFANLAASVSIQKIGITGTATMREILLQYDNNFSETE